jgi:hypothetical protein
MKVLLKKLLRKIDQAPKVSDEYLLKSNIGYLIFNDKRSAILPYMYGLLRMIG